MSITALALNCTLNPSPTPSSTELIAQQVLDALAEHDVNGSMIRVVDHDVRPGVEADMGDGDAWPEIRRRLLAADILVLATPTWLGQHSSVCQRVFERLDAELSETDDHGRPLTYGKVAVVAVVGNEDGAHHIIAIALQALNDVGFTVPAQSGVYWNGEAMHTTDFKDLAAVPEKVATTTGTLAANAAHLVSILQPNEYPAVS
ncbi:flavodoxin family protein [Microlunatus soli]|uniref:Multimeric flavodoxin WrbA n=1 Tax=Microlunatus soli TaxID=630515 RepID=A0A1H1N9M5_9ACTN|nr:NAD(P)H-dependent oxidoreductase [Microlunatus soli]SDR94939.1 Multimeric flavodoxin WrbA [Microlunatus soli]